MKQKINRILSILYCIFLVAACSVTLMSSSEVPGTDLVASAAEAVPLKEEDPGADPDGNFSDEENSEESVSTVGAAALFDQLYNLPVEENAEAAIAKKMRWLRAHASLFPGNTVINAAGNPELIRFLYCYGQSLDENGNSVLHPEVDDGLTPDELAVKVPYLYQWDPRWGFKEYGSSVIGITGCGPTCTSMAIIGLSGNASATPWAIADYAMTHDYYEDGEGTRWALFENVAAEYGLVCRQFTVSERAVMRELENGRILICSMGPGIFTACGHFIVISGLRDGMLVIHDPNNRAYSERLWSYDEIREDIQAGFSFRIPEPEDEGAGEAAG